MINALQIEIALGVRSDSTERNYDRQNEDRLYSRDRQFSRDTDYGRRI